MGWRLLAAFCHPLLPIKAETTHTCTLNEGPYRVVGTRAATIQEYPLDQIRVFKANNDGATVVWPHGTSEVPRDTFSSGQRSGARETVGSQRAQSTTARLQPVTLDNVMLLT